MNRVSIGENHGLRVGLTLLSIVALCIIIGGSWECDEDAVGGIFMGAGGLGKYIQDYTYSLVLLSAMQCAMQNVLYKKCYATFHWYLQGITLQEACKHYL